MLASCRRVLNCIVRAICDDCVGLLKSVLSHLVFCCLGFSPEEQHNTHILSSNTDTLQQRAIAAKRRLIRWRLRAAHQVAPTDSSSHGTLEQHAIAATRRLIRWRLRAAHEVAPIDSSNHNTLEQQASSATRRLIRWRLRAAHEVAPMDSSKQKQLLTGTAGASQPREGERSSQRRATLSTRQDWTHRNQ